METSNYGKQVKHFIGHHGDKGNCNLSDAILIALIELMGGEQVFLESIENYDMDVDIQHFSQLDDDDVANDFFNEHKADILEHLADMAPRFDKESAVELVAYEMDGDYSCDEVAEAFFGCQPMKTIDNIDVDMRRWAVAFCLDDIHAWFVELNKPETDGWS